MTKRQPCVLVVDDDDTTRGMLLRVVSPMGFRVIEASNGAQALAFCETEKIDLVVQDLRLPGGASVTGMRLILRIRHAIGWRIPILVISGAPQDELDVVREAGFIVLEKPFEVGHIRTVIESLRAHINTTDEVAVLRTTAQLPALEPATRRPAWMPLLGVLTFFGAIGLHWKADAPDGVVYPLMGFALMLIWIGPTPSDVAQRIMALIKKDK